MAGLGTAADRNVAGNNDVRISIGDYAAGRLLPEAPGSEMVTEYS